MQRDEFLPLAVIRDVLAQGATRQTRRRRPRVVGGADARLSLEELVAETDAEPGSCASWRSSSCWTAAPRRLHPHRRRDRDALPAARPLRRGGAPPEGVPVGRRPRGGLLEQILAPSLRSSNPDRREAGLEELEALAELTSELTHLLLVRDLRELVRCARRGQTPVRGYSLSYWTSDLMS